MHVYNIKIHRDIRSERVAINCAIKSEAREVESDKWNSQRFATTTERGEVQVLNNYLQNIHL